MVIAGLITTIDGFVALLQTFGGAVFAGSLIRFAYMLLWSDTNPNKRAEGWGLLISSIIGLAILASATDIATLFVGKIQ